MITFSEFIDSNPVIFIYHAGSGGEFISKTFAKYGEDIEPIPFIQDEGNNQTHSIGALHYSSNWPTRNNPNTWVNDKFVPSNNGSRYVSKDHPTSYNMEYYLKYARKATYVYLYADTERDFFAKLAFAKLGKRVEGQIDNEYIRKNVNDLLSEQQEEMIIKWAAKYDWVWAHELLICNTKLKEGHDLTKFEHTDSLDRYVNDHVAQDKTYFDMMNYYSNLNASRIHGICIDDLVTSSKHFWNNLSKTLFVPLSSDKGNITRETDFWIHKNHKLLVDKR